MNYRVFILAAASITVGLVELIVGGILPLIAEELNVTIGSAGQLITVFALVFAIAGPVLLSLTANIERKKLFLITLTVFFFGNMMTFFSPTFTLVMVARVITAISAALIIVLSLTITSRIVEPKHRAKSLGIIYMGVSSALVLGVPVGILVTEAVGWRMIFLGIAVLTLLTVCLVYSLLDQIPAEKMKPLSEQIKSLANLKIAGAHLTIMFMLAGHYTFYAYFATFLETTLNLSPNWISVFYFLFGISAVCGGGLGGVIADRLGSAKSILIVIGSFAVVLFLLPHATVSTVLFIIMMMAWGALSWSLAPALQNYIIESAPDSFEIHQSINNSALQVGIALGAAIGGTVLSQTSSALDTAWVGALVVLIAFLCAVFSIKLPVRSLPSTTPKRNEIM